MSHWHGILASHSGDEDTNKLRVRVSLPLLALDQYKVMHMIKQDPEENNLEEYDSTGPEKQQNNRTLISCIQVRPFAEVQREQIAARRLAREVAAPPSQPQGSTRSVKPEPVDDSLFQELDEDQKKSEPMTEEEIRRAVADLNNPKFKIKEESQFDPLSVGYRLKAAGLVTPFHIALDEETLQFLHHRYHIRDLYGGNSQQTLPQVSAERVALHGVNDFAFLRRDYNPHAPTKPGHSGLWFSSAAAGKWPKIQRVFVRMRSGLWIHCGFYKLKPSWSLTTDEFKKQEKKVKETWCRRILVPTTDWGVGVRVRVWTRREYGREPTKADFANPDVHKRVIAELRWQDISNAYENGEEQIGVWTMQCVGYDVEFQRFLVANQPIWRAMKAEAKENKGKKLKAQTFSKAGTKRKAAPDPELSSGEEDFAGDDRESDGEDMMQRAYHYTARGTKSRPWKRIARP
ncbi:hypothetical protein B0H21DRAFT_156507 [Amylocystis lapponica]|nr:hypothetical protein B0H21DRAFT_156507 [Amylocystis lapponica]